MKYKSGYENNDKGYLITRKSEPWDIIGWEIELAIAMTRAASAYIVGEKCEEEGVPSIPPAKDFEKELKKIEHPHLRLVECLRSLQSLEDKVNSTPRNENKVILPFK